MTKRTQFVELNGGKIPTPLCVSCVPKGSLLGPRLFSIYENDFSKCISNGELHLYADDTIAFVIGNSVDQVTDNLNILLSEIWQWCRVNKLTINAKKCEAMTRGYDH